MKKKAPKSSNKKNKGKKKKKIIALAFIVFIAILAVLYYILQPSSKDIIAKVDGKGITKEELDWWYKTSVLPEYRGAITKEHFLVVSLIPQEVLLQEAKRQNIEVTKDELEKALGLHIIENGLTLDEFEKHLNSRGIILDEIRDSFRIKATITKLLGKEGIRYTEGEDTENDLAFQTYLDNLINNSEIKIFQENINKAVLKSFEETNDKICNEGKPLVILFTTTKCEVCKKTALVFENSVEEFTKQGRISSFHWSLDNGDNLLTEEKEIGIPKNEVSLFKKYSSDMQIPVTIVGCKYKRIGSLTNEDEYELKSILEQIAGG